MLREKREINKELYDSLCQASKEERDEMIYDFAIHAGYHPAGYGCWGSRYYKEDNKYYLSWCRQRSCD